MFLLAPVKWLVNLVTFVVPDLLRPGVFLGLVLFIVWFAFVQRGLPSLWHALCRVTARVVDAAVGIFLLPDYLMTTARRKQEQPPGEATLMIGGVAERVLDGAGGLYQRHQREPMEWKRFPWLPVAIAIVVVTLPWAAMELFSPKSEVRQELSQGYDVWREVESWAGVPPSRRASPGVLWPPRPRVLDVRDRGRRVGVTVRCFEDERCRGRLVVRSGKGVRLHTREVSAQPGATVTARMKLSREEARANRVLVRVARVGPE